MLRDRRALPFRSLPCALLLFLGLLPIFGQGTKPSSARPHVVILGGGSSHDFEQSYGRTDAQTLRDAGCEVVYTQSFADLARRLPWADTVIQASNQAPPDSTIRQALMEFVARGGGFVAAHAGTWYNWPGWPEYNRQLIGGGTRDHDRLGPFAVAVVDPSNPVMAGVPAHFLITDELYHQELAAVGPPVTVLANAHSSLTGKTYPSVWIVQGQRGRIVGIALGHDEQAHTNPAYRSILRNAVRWTAARAIRGSAGTAGETTSPGAR